jgi:hypothetical protein
MSEHVESHNQKGGITAHNVDIGTQVNVINRVPIYKKKKVVIPAALLLISTVVAVINNSFGVFDHLFKKESPIMFNKEYPQQVHNVTSYNQSGGVTAHTVNVNQQRAILPQAQVRKGKQEDSFILQVILSQTSGIWDQGTIFKLQVKTSGPYKTARFVGGMPSGLNDFRTGENKENGFFECSTTTAPLKGEPIILEIQSATDIDLKELGVEPLAKN